MVLAVTAFPDAQRKAREELDRVIGSDRAPEWEDFQDLPYICALIKEVHRFRPVASLIPRAATADLMVSPSKVMYHTRYSRSFLFIVPRIHDSQRIHHYCQYLYVSERRLPRLYEVR